MYSDLSSPPDLYPLAPKLEELGRRRRQIEQEELEWSRLAADARTFPQRLHDAVAEHLAGRQVTVERLLCDCGVRRIVLDPKSVVVDVGRSRRVVTPAGRRAMESREKGLCGCPGCDRAGRTIHHLKPWAQGGPTDLENQVLLCYWHHRMVHEGGWRLARVETGELMLVRPPPELRSAA